MALYLKPSNVHSSSYKKDAHQSFCALNRTQISQGTSNQPVLSSKGFVTSSESAEVNPVAPTIPSLLSSKNSVGQR
jgi:hypothetical protein